MGDIRDTDSLAKSASGERCLILAITKSGCVADEKTKPAVTNSLPITAF